MKPTLADALVHARRLIDCWQRPAAIIGGCAMIGRVRPRVTQDVDLVIDVPSGGGGDVVALATAVGFSHDEAETARLLDGGLVRLWRPPSRELGIGLDLIFVDSPFLARLVARAQPVDFGSVVAPVATLEDLLLTKLEANRPIDIDDVLAIKDAHGPTLDREYLDAGARELGVERELRLYLDGQPAS